MMTSIVLIVAVAAMMSEANAQQTDIPIHFKGDRSGFVTLVVEDKDGNRLKNLTFDQPVQPGENVVHWDGSAVNGMVKPGDYHIRGLFHEDITPVLEYSFYSGGNPPWPTKDGRGAWLADHTAPAAALFLPEGSPWPAGDVKPVVLVGADSAEAGSALMWLDLDGHKLGGTKIRGWNGAIALARDIGSQGNKNHVAYSVFVNNPSRDFGVANPGGLELYIIAKTGLEPLAKIKGGVQIHDAYRELVGLAACNGLLILANTVANELVAFDVRGTNRLPYATIKLEKLGGIAFEPDGKLLVISDGAVKRFAVENDWKSLKLSGEQVVVTASAFQSPKQIIEHDKEIFVADWGDSHQVKVFDAITGRGTRTIGKAGGPQIGAYDEQRMAHPLGMCVDSRGLLWVAEEDFLPKRISRWNAKTGKFINAWYGPTQYGGGGFVDPKDKYRAYYPSIGNPGSMGLLEFRIDPQTGESKMTAVRYRFPDPLNDLISYGGYRKKAIFFPTDMVPMGSHGGTCPGQTFYYKGHQYFTDSYNTYWYEQSNFTTLWVLENDVCRPIACCGWVSSGNHRWEMLDSPEIKKMIPEGDPQGTFYVWVDRNHDHALQADEIQFIRPGVNGYQGVVFQPDLSIISGGPIQLPVASINEQGVPSYDVSQLKIISKTFARGDVAMSPDGWFVVNFAGFKDGQARWALATSDTKAPPTGPGDLKDPKRMLGYPVKSALGEAGYLIARYSYMGEIYIYSMDGLLVTTLGADIRKALFWPYPEQKLGMAITNLTFDAEHFWPFMFGNDDGNVYLSLGKWHTSIVRLNGLDKVRRLDLGEIKVTPKMLSAASLADGSRIKIEGSHEELTVVAVQAKIDGKFDEWPVNGWTSINEKCNFRLGLDGDKLVAAYQTDQKQLLRNAATEFPYAFTQGGGLDLMLRTGTNSGGEPQSGDERLFVTKRNGQILAVLYRQKTDGGGNKETFASPVGQVTFDDVKDVSKYVEVASDGANYEFSVPLSVLGLKDPVAKTFRGDAGLVLSDGSRARARVYWHNKSDSMCADVPSEARLNPSQWGRFDF
ncbi:MAG: repeat containing protein [Pedosphaera sp.]|nr:repeat containing protein [Pedosphaera sp.]